MVEKWGVGGGEIRKEVFIVITMLTDSAIASAAAADLVVVIELGDRRPAHPLPPHDLTSMSIAIAVDEDERH